MVYNHSAMMWTNRTIPEAKTRSYVGMASANCKIYAHGGKMNCMIYSNSNLYLVNASLILRADKFDGNCENKYVKFYIYTNLKTFLLKTRQFS